MTSPEPADFDPNDPAIIAEQKDLGMTQKGYGRYRKQRQRDLKTDENLMGYQKKGKTRKARVKSTGFCKNCGANYFIGEEALPCETCNSAVSTPAKTQKDRAKKEEQ